ncbi:hypothetical protein HYD78_00970 [Mycoplasmopsis bovis]|nr:hypothetical protein [Mycoplasmopsis bovis]QQH43256.1 hypothetical protein HYD78_00970 [Mycoplasmopsis bovis]
MAMGEKRLQILWNTIQRKDKKKKKEKRQTSNLKKRKLKNTTHLIQTAKKNIRAYKSRKIKVYKTI